MVFLDRGVRDELDSLSFSNKSLDDMQQLDWEQQSQDQIDRLASVQPARAAITSSMQAPVFEAPPAQSLALPRRASPPDAGQFRTVWKADPSQPDVFGGPAPMPQPSPAASSAPAQAAAYPQAASGVPSAMPSGQPSTAGDGSPPQALTGGDRPARIAAARQYADAAEARTGVPADVNLAFAVHESGLEDRYGPGNSFHGRHAVDGEDGTPITDWGYDSSGNRVDYPTKLKSYQTPAGSFDDFADLIANSPRYRPALDRYRQTGDKDQLIRDIWAAGYGESKTGPDETVNIRQNQTAGSGAAPSAQNALAAAVSPPARPSAGASSAQQQGGSLDIGDVAQRYGGGTYVFGGGRDAQGGIPGDPNSDCSAFVSGVWRERGLNLTAHTDGAYNQLKQLGARQVSEAEAQPGDVVFYMGSGYGGNITYHMGIYAGPGQILDQSRWNGDSGVKVRPLSHAGGPDDIVILRDPRVNGRVAKQASEAPPPIRRSGIAESPLGDRITQAAGAQAQASAYGDGGDSQKALGAADLPDTGLSAGDQKRAKLAATSQDMLRAPLGPPTQGPDTATGAEDSSLPYDPRAADQGAHELPPPDLQQTPPAAYGQSQDDPGTAPLPFDVPQYTYLPSSAPLQSDQANMVETPVTRPGAPVAASYGASQDDPGQAPAPPRVEQAGMPAPSGFPGLQAVYDSAGNFLHWIQGAAQDVGNAITSAAAVDENPSPEERAQRASVAGLGPDDQLFNAARTVAGTAPPVQSTPGEPDYVPPGPSLRGIMEQNTGFSASQRMRQIEANAAAAQGITDPVRAMAAPLDPAWRAQNPEMAREYDDLQTQLGFVVGGTFGSMHEAPRPQPQTVEVLQQRVEQAQNIVRRILDTGADPARLAAAQENRAALESELIDAQNARRALEPRIRSDVGRRIEETTPSDVSFEDRMDAQFPPRAGQMRPEDLSGPVGVPVDDPRMRLGSGVVPEDSRRMYHGTAGAFERPDPAAMTAPGLYGPGYYLTPDPEVAGRYAEIRAYPDRRTVEDMQAQLDRVRAELASGTSGSRQVALQAAEDNLTRRILEESARSGPNIRAVDLPQDVRLFDNDGTVKQTDIRRIELAASRTLGGRFKFEPYATESGGAIRTALYEELGDWGAVNGVLHDAGFDGIQARGATPGQGGFGGDEVVIFPESLDKITNAFSGEAGGSGVIPRPGSSILPTLGNATQGAVLADVAANQEDERRQAAGQPPMTAAERAAFIASGAGLAVMAGRAMRGRSEGRRLGSGVVPEGGRAFDRPNRPPNLGDVPPSQIREPGLPGMERPPTPMAPELRGAVDATPNASLTVEQARANQGVREPTLPGMEAPRAPIGPELRGNVSEQPNVPLSITQAQANASAAQPQIPGLIQQPAPAPIGQVAQQFQLPPQVQNAVQAAQRQQKPGVNPLEWWRRFAGEVGYSSMIGPATATVNLTGNALEGLWAIPKEGARAIARGAPREALEMAGGAFHGLSEVGSAIVDALAARGRYAPTPGHEPLSSVTNNPIGRAVTTGLEAGGRVFSAVPDAIFGTIAQGAGEARAAAQIATDSGLKGTAWKQMVNDLLTDAKSVKAGQLPTLADTQRVLDEGAAYARRQTFQDELGAIGRNVRKFATVSVVPDGQGGSKPLPIIGNLITPFFNTPWNMNTRLMERTPIGYAMNSQGGRFDKLYDATLGSALLLGLAAGPVAAGTITGGGPDDPQKKAEMRAQGWRPYSTLIDGVYVPNRVMGIYAPLLNAAADVHDSIAYTRDRTPGSIASNYVGRLGTQLQQQPYLQGLSNIMQAVQAGQGGGLGNAAERYASSTITRMVPYAATARTIGTALDPLERTTDQGKNTPAETTIGQQVRGGVGLRSDLPVAQDVLGRPQANPQQGVGALFAKTSSQKPDPTVQAFLDANVDIPAPHTKVTIGGAPMDLTENERRRWNEIRGDMLTRLVRPIAENGALARMPAGTREKMLQQYLSMASDQADTRVFAEMDAQDRARRLRDAITSKSKAS